MRTVLSISLPEKVASELEHFAKRMGRNKSDIVKESLGVFIWEAKLHDLKKRLEAKAKKAGIVN
jgi:predicted DNA-binding protein